MTSRRLVATWVVALLGVLLYKPLSPRPWDYYDHPRMLVLSVVAAVLVSLMLYRYSSNMRMIYCGVLLILGTLGVSFKPEFCKLRQCLQAPAVLWRSVGSDCEPILYRGESPYHWEDYGCVLGHLRRMPPDTHVANVLMLGAAITGPTARPSAFPVESIRWLLVNRDDEAALATALEQSSNSVVVWAPEREASSLPPSLLRTIRRLYLPDARFGDIEVWRRKEGGGGSRYKDDGHS